MGVVNKLDVHFSSKSDEWATPQELFDQLSAKYGPFNVDVCATAENCKVWVRPQFTKGFPSFFSKEQDGLSVEWAKSMRFIGDGPGGTIISEYVAPTCWMNPPYSRGQQAKWIKKAYEESQKGCTVVALLPARTDTRAFHTYIWDRDRNAPREGVEIDFLKGRVKFEDPEAKCANPAPFPSMVVVFRPPDERPQTEKVNETVISGATGWEF